jgi:hypothetical protein
MFPKWRAPAIKTAVDLREARHSISGECCSYNLNPDLVVEAWAWGKDDGPERMLTMERAAKNSQKKKNPRRKSKRNNHTWDWHRQVSYMRRY